MNENIAVIGIKRSFVNGEFVGSRLRAAIQNEAGYKFKPYTDRRTKERKFSIKESLVPSFRAPYLICEGSDIFNLGTGDVERFIKVVESYGYKQIQFDEEVLKIARFEFKMKS